MAKKDFNALVLKPVAHISTDFPTKFGIPRQGTIVSSLKGKIVFEEEFRKEGILRGLEGFSHIWLIWGFSGFDDQEFSPTVRPPKLGGNTRVGVFASRSPNRPNPIGLSAVKIEEIVTSGKDAPFLVVSGIDIMDGTPIYDIKPYIPFSDSLTNATEGYTKETRNRILLDVVIPPQLKNKIKDEHYSSLVEILKEDPRPGFQHEEKRIYGFTFAGMEIQFHVEDEKTLIVDNITSN